jgi:hypothetical protein
MWYRVRLNLQQRCYRQIGNIVKSLLFYSTGYSGISRRGFIVKSSFLYIVQGTAESPAEVLSSNLPFGLQRASTKTIVVGNTGYYGWCRELL